MNLPENYPPQFFYEILSQFPKTFIVAKHGLQTVGYIMIRVEKTLSVLKWVNRAHVISVTVHKAFRRQGIGRRLMLIACNNAYSEYKATEVYLEVRVTNAPAISLYKKLGFEIKEVSVGYYSDGEDAYVMQAQLPLKEG
ncbi:ribosomal-protein-alanine N-acetyltransferase [Candidatus Marsarchaeota G2 archaeon OSP_D]|uniref:Ribosomal-protein-alanine N-acetyltransferase n=5 Tax=Candidatus Marsarchaeota group 2 TaxID=2203771 RepID=A0A2R6BBH4_9ARCH|nr:MAG: ribosomal-protein-alanine N-acetyltransferase [Candidatus Marsarchaeota G2 archaeon OSP_D]PSN91961.1 MAG: ribosomal-protein-alanine N-acetyltransferase [Candidatus Marsarchaeota G2 archaeon ECH_B_SAG-M15]PSN96014.1 MAG: ribosomal-protein-alanine N-acetyltransferase [Candidatus Marsarchaeota G2 archaeon ECH_B_2]PSO00790.1 MAG: ribosomal-protein-alanine N-acetyltransferase [Candidatus Marsarchaeota G2 archaeon ECH_B_3]PSO02589.1 MAG: ribosomal-protein-alanine N-acetyltransferase [Candidat